MHDLAQRRHTQNCVYRCFSCFNGSPELFFAFAVLWMLPVRLGCSLKCAVPVAIRSGNKLPSEPHGRPYDLARGLDCHTEWPICNHRGYCPYRRDRQSLGITWKFTVAKLANRALSIDSHGL